MMEYNLQIKHYFLYIGVNAILTESPNPRQILFKFSALYALCFPGLQEDV